MSDITLTNTSFNGTTAVLSWSHTIGALDDYLIVGISLEDGSNTIDGCTLDGTALILGEGAKNASLATAIYYTSSAGLPSPGAATIVISTAENAAGVVANAISGHGFAQQAPSATSVGSVAGSTTVKTSLTTSVNGTLIFDTVCAAYMGASFTPDVGQIEVFDLDNRSGLSHAMSYEETVAAGVGSMGWTSTLSHSHLVQVAAAFSPDEEGGGTPVSSVSRDIPHPIYGVTIDDISGLSDIVTALDDLTYTPVTRIVFDEDQAPSVYNTAVNDIGSVSYIMGEVLDSSAVSSYHVSSYSARVSSYLAYYGDRIDIWECANEINGEWLGSESDSAAKMVDAYDQVKALGYRAAITFYYNEDCTTFSWEEMFTWINANVPSRILQGLDYCLISWWEEDCNDLEKTASEWGSVFSQLATLFPNAKVGFSEVGTYVAGDRAAFMEKFYELSINLNAYIGGYFWWYWKTDCVPKNALWTTFDGIVSALPAPSVEGPSGGGGGGTGEITYDSDVEAGDANVTTLAISSFGVPSESDLLLVCHLGLEDKSATGLTVNSIGFGGTAGTLAVEDSETTSDTIKSLIYYWLDADLPSSNGAFGIAMSAEVRTISANLTFVHGAAQQAPETTGTANAGASTSVNPTLTTSTDGAFVFSNITTSAGGTSLSPGASQTERFEYAGASSHAGGDKEVATAGSTNNTWNASAADNLVATAAAFAPEVTVTETLENYYLTGARTTAGDASGDTATYTFTIPREAYKVDVFAWWPTGGYATDTPFTITGVGAGNTATIDVDQSARGGQKNYIGGLSGRIMAGEFTVVIGDDANGPVVADAVWIEVTYAVPPRSDIPVYDGVYPQRHYSRRLAD
jgi:hypothetical protein